MVVRSDEGVGAHSVLDLDQDGWSVCCVPSRECKKQTASAGSAHESARKPVQNRQLINLLSSLNVPLTSPSNGATPPE